MLFFLLLLRALGLLFLDRLNIETEWSEAVIATDHGVTSTIAIFARVRVYSPKWMN